MKNYAVTLLLSVLMVVSPAMALTDTFGAHVTTVSADDTLNTVYFQVDTKVDGCNGGQYLQYAGHTADQATNQASVRSTFELLLAARQSGQTVHIIGNGDAGPIFCSVHAVELRGNN